MRKAARLGLPVAKPCNEGERYDFIARVDNVCWRVQVKSVFTKARSRSHYRIKTSTGTGRWRRNLPYSAKEIDFMVAYIYPERAWYVFPASAVEGRAVFCLWPGSKKSRFEQYREAWKLMKPASAETAVAKEQAAGT